MGDLVLKGSTSGQITVTPTAVAGTNTLTLPAVTGNIITSADSGTVTQAMLSTNVAGNGPAFSAYPSVTQSFTTATETLVQYNTETLDTNTCYDPGSGQYKFTPTVVGYYFISATLGFALSSSTCGLKLYKNGAPGTGTQLSFAQVTNNSGIISIYTSAIVYLNGSTDFVVAYARQDTGSTNSNFSLGGLTPFNGVLVRAG